MPIANMRALIRDAQAKRRAVGAFNIANMETAMGVVRAAEEENTPVILQIAQARMGEYPLSVFGAIMRAAAEAACVPVGVHFDHALTREMIARALDLGFTSVMYDGSSLPMAENIQNTLEVIALARPYGAAVEAEIGRLGYTETGEKAKAQYTDAGEALTFLAETGADALAIAIGNAHGVYEGTPQLHFDIIRRISEKNDTPLVLHGGTGLTKNDFQRCIECGMHKINIGTACYQAASDAAACGRADSIFHISAVMADNVRRVTRTHLKIFAGTGKDA